MRHNPSTHSLLPRRSAPCPLCFTPIVARELRLLKHTLIQAAAVGHNLSFQLLRRGKGSILPQLGGEGLQPNSAAADLAASGAGSTAEPAPAAGVTRFSKFSTADLSEAVALWRETARKLATHAAEVCEGGVGGSITWPPAASHLSYVCVECCCHA